MIIELTADVADFDLQADESPFALSADVADFDLQAE